jgi:hypothetical protein
MKNLFLLLPLLILAFSLKSQTSNAKWSLILDGYNDVYISDIAVDTLGNTYAAINYTSELKIPILNKKLPKPPHIFGLILKIDRNGNPNWAHPIKSKFMNKIEDISIAPNGDLLITGCGDGLVCFPGKNDTLKIGKTQKKSDGLNRVDVVYAARYSPNGDRKWVNYFTCSFGGSGMSIAANKKNEVFMSYSYYGEITQNDKILDSIPNRKKVEEKIAIARFDKKGKLKAIKCLGYEQRAIAINSTNLTFDNQNNLIVYGLFNGKIKLSKTDSLTNDSYYEGSDSYIAKYSVEGKLIWVRKIGGQSMQKIKDLTIGNDNSIYATGEYSGECFFSNGISINQKSKYEWKSGNSLFYTHLYNNGELDFIQFEDSKGYASNFIGEAIDIDQNGKVHLVGHFTNTLQKYGFSIETSQHNSNGFYSIWKNQSLESLEKIGETQSWLIPRKLKINKESIAVGGEYYGDNNSSLNLNGKKVKLSNNDYGRNVFIYGGIIPYENPKQESVAKQDSVKNSRIEKIEPMLACTKPNENPAADNWFPIVDSLNQLDSLNTITPCGSTIKGMEASLFPNPTVDELNLKFIGIEGIVQLDIYSSDGSLILSQRIEKVQNEQTILFNLKQLPSGTYLVQINHKNFQKALRFIKVN